VSRRFGPSKNVGETFPIRGITGDWEGTAEEMGLEAFPAKQSVMTPTDVLLHSVPQLVPGN